MKITDDMVDLFRRGLTLQDAEGKYDDERNAVRKQLASLLGLKPWQDNPLDVGDEPPAWMHDLTEPLAERKKAIKLRHQLLDRLRGVTESRDS